MQTTMQGSGKRLHLKPAPLKVSASAITASASCLSLGSEGSRGDSGNSSSNLCRVHRCSESSILVQ
jgi:hypothetical protein